MRPAKNRILPEPLRHVGRNFVLSGKGKLLYFGGCDYFRLSSHPQIVRAVQAGVRTYGINVSASRKTTGNHSIYEKLEQALARFFDAERAVLIGTGYMTNLVVAQALRHRCTHVLLDERAHPSLRDASVLFGCPVLHFKHRDASDAASVLKRCGPKAIPALCTDGMFSHDGSVAPLRAYLKILPRKGLMLVDDAHAAGVIGRTGKGTLEYLGLPTDRVIRTITLSKAFGLYGGAILCDKEIQQSILTRSAMFTGHTPLPLPIAHAALTSLDLLAKDRKLRGRLETNAAFVHSKLPQAAAGNQDGPTPILSWVPKDQADSQKLSSALFRAGIHPPLVQYPGGPKHGYFRFMISSEHTKPQLELLLEVLKERIPALTAREQFVFR
jgi:8-amino-7-oxononanoate synthase